MCIRDRLGSTGKSITDVLHIGIGGSYLGPRMIDEALTPYRDQAINCHYVANVDGHHIDHVLADLNWERTLIIVVSKSFSTMETSVTENEMVELVRFRSSFGL